MSPKSIIARLTPCLVAGFNTYGFDENGNFNELSRLHLEDLPADEFWIGGEIIRNMKAEQRKHLQDAGAKLYENPQKLIIDLANDFLG